MKPRAIIVDIDGTLADCSRRVHHIQKTPKDWDAFYTGCGEDKPIGHIHWLLCRMKTFDDIQVLFVTGRAERIRLETANWLHQREIFAFELFMRPDGDHRTDDILKREIYERDIAPYYDVLFALEDRGRVCQMWRSIGVPCLQVADGDF